MARLRYEDPLLEIFIWVPVNCPDWLTRTSSPAYATSLGADSNLDISPISPMITPPKTFPIPGMVVITWLVCTRSSVISFSSSLRWFSMNLICSIICLIWKEKAFEANLIPKELFAALWISSAFDLPYLPRLHLEMKLESFVALTESISSGVGYFKSNSLEVTPNISENKLLYSGNTWSNKQITLRFKSEQSSTKQNLYLESWRRAMIFSSDNEDDENWPKRIIWAITNESLESFFVWRI